MAPVQRQIEYPPAGAAPATSAPSQMPVLPTLAGGERDAGAEAHRLADEVYDLLVRRLATEREQRGL